MKLKFIPVVLGAITTTLLAVPMQARAAEVNSMPGIAPSVEQQLMQGVHLTPQQKAEIEQIKQQSEARIQQILTPEQFRLHEAILQNPTDRSSVIALVRSLSPDQKQELLANLNLALRESNAVYTPQQRAQIDRNVEARLEARVAELKAEHKLASTFQLGYWQPRARVNPDQPLQVEVINQTNVPLQYALTTDAGKTVLPGESADVSNISLPADVLVYPAAQGASLQYDVTTVGNTAIVNVRQVADDTPGNGSLAIDPTGAIYVY